MPLCHRHLRDGAASGTQRSLILSKRRRTTQRGCKGVGWRRAADVRPHTTKEHCTRDSFQPRGRQRRLRRARAVLVWSPTMWDRCRFCVAVSRDGALAGAVVRVEVDRGGPGAFGHTGCGCHVAKIGARTRRSWMCDGYLCLSWVGRLWWWRGCDVDPGFAAGGLRWVLCNSGGASRRIGVV